MPFALKKSEAIPAGVRRVVGERIDRALSTLKNGSGAASDTAVHDVRKRLKQIRGALRLVRDELGEKVYARENRVYRDAGRPLSTVRDARVLIDSLDRLIEQFPGTIDPRKLASLRRAMRTRHQQTRKTALQRNHAARKIAGELRDGRSRLSDWPLAREGWKAIEPGLHKAYKRGRRAMEKACDDPSDDALHEWRKRTKDLRYQLELLAGVRPRKIAPLAKQAKALSDLLGDDHDLCVLSAALHERPQAKGGADAAESIDALIANRRADLQKKAHGLGKKLYKDSSQTFIRQLHRYWKAAS